MKVERFTREFYIIILIDACLAIAREMFQPVFSLFLQGRGASAVEIGAIVSIAPIATILARFVLGPLSDRTGPGWFLLICLLGQPIVFALYAFAPSVSWFYLIQVVSSLTIAMFNPLLMSLVLRIAPRTHRGDAMGRYLSAAGLSTLMGPLLGGLLLELLDRDYGGVFLVAVVPALLSLGSLMFLAFRTEFGSVLFASERRSTDSSTTQGDGFFKNLRAVFFNQNMASLTVSRVAFSFTLAFFRTLFPLYAVNNLGHSPSSMAFIFTIYGLMNTLLRLPSGRFSDRVGRKIPLLMSIALMVAVNLGFSTAREYTAIGFIAGFYGACHGMRAVSEWAFLGDIVSPTFRGLANSYFSNIFDIGTSLGAFAGGVMASFLPISTVFQIAAAIMALNAVAVGLLAHHDRRKMN